MDDQFSIVTGPSPKQRLERSNLSCIGVITKLGASYIVPDVTQEHFQELMSQIDLRSEKIMIRNISEAMLMLPFRIIQSIILVEDIVDMVYGELWKAPDVE